MPTKIEWTDESWNPVTGCTKISLGCKNCYAERMAKRLAGRFGYPEIPHHFDVTFHPDRMEQPLRWCKPRQVFVCSMGDLFHKDVPFSFIGKVFATIIAADWHTFQILTKRPERMRAFVSWFQAKTALNLRSFRRIWLGVSIENQAAADERREYLRQVPAAIKYVSYEPALALVDWTGWEFVDQIISGGESGPKARPSHPSWHRLTRDFCREHGIAYFFKHHGEYVPADGYNQWGTSLDGEFVDAAKVHVVRIVPENIHSTVHMVRVGKKRAGRLLDGREYNEFPSHKSS